MRALTGIFETFLKRLAPLFFSSSEQHAFLETFSLQLSGGVSVGEALQASEAGMRSWHERLIIRHIRRDIRAGISLADALSRTGAFSASTISLVTIAEESGELVSYLQFLVEKERREQNFRSKVRGALLYPSVVIIVALVVGVSVSWFILPRLSGLFNRLDIDLPLITEWLLAFGSFLSENGTWAVPLSVFGLFAFVYIVFWFKPTKHIGQWIILHTPGVSELIKNTELARFGYILGSLLSSGVPIRSAFHALSEGTSMSAYQKLYQHLTKRIEAGEPLADALAEYKNSKALIPAPIQQLIYSGERSGSLPESMRRIGESYTEKVEQSARVLTTVLEPILLFIVWIAVLFVAIAIILPIYNLTGSINAGR